MADEQVQAPAPEAPAPEEAAVQPVEPAVEPRAGQNVHYVYGNSPVQAVIMEVYEDGSVRLQAATGGFSASPIFYDVSGADGTFHYPEE